MIESNRCPLFKCYREETSISADKLGSNTGGEEVKPAHICLKLILRDSNNNDVVC